jgi:hypothetical protein
VGLATHLYFGLTPVPDLWAGYLLWPADQLAEVVTAWAAALPTIGPALTTTISLLHAAPGPPFPAGLQGRPLVHLALASSAGPDAASGLFEALHPVAPPVVNTWGRADAQRLGEIHLDPPAGIPAIGGGRWLASNTPDVATAILSAGLLERTPLQMIEIRHLANPDPPSEGAMTSVPGPFLVHAVGAAQGGGQRSAIDGALAGVWAAAAPADTGRVAPPFAEGQREPGTALEPAGLARVQAIRSLLDPAGRIRTARRLP